MGHWYEDAKNGRLRTAAVGGAPLMQTAAPTEPDFRYCTGARPVTPSRVVAQGGWSGIDHATWTRRFGDTRLDGTATLGEHGRVPGASLAPRALAAGAAGRDSRASVR